MLENIQSQNDIVEVISQYFPLKRSGQNFKALCPFHSEKTPSFFVSPHKQIFHCFGCGAGGDVFTFIMNREGMTFPEAVRFLAERAHIDLPAEDYGRRGKKEELLKLHELALGYFHWGLMKSSRGGAAREYLEKREITADSVELFKLGYAQPTWDSFLRHAGKKGYKPQLLEEAGLILRRSGGSGWYDRFRNRLIIPVFDTRGRVIAFGGRVLDDSQPKYINSPDTPLFRKGRMLFGLHRAKDAIVKGEEAILGEGYFDVIRAHQEGIGNMVCAQGTAFTLIQAQILKRYADKVVTAFDADQAGSAAALRGLDIFLEKNFEVRIALLPAGEDPDSFIRKNGGEAFRKAVEQSIPLLDFKLADLCEKHNLNSDRGKLTVVRQMLDTISRIESAVLRDSYIKKLARKLNVSESSLREDYRKRKPRRVKENRKKEAISGPEERAQRRLLQCLLRDDKLMSLVLDEFDPADFSPLLRPIAEKMLLLYRKGVLPLSQSLPAALREKELQSLISGWLLESGGQEPVRKEIIDLLVYVKKMGLAARGRELERQISDYSGKGKDIAELQRDSRRLRKQLEDLPDRLKEKFQA